jgi:hypothetical protein
VRLVEFDVVLRETVELIILQPEDMMRQRIKNMQKPRFLRFFILSLLLDKNEAI